VPSCWPPGTSQKPPDHGERVALPAHDLLDAPLQTGVERRADAHGTGRQLADLVGDAAQEVGRREAERVVLEDDRLGEGRPQRRRVERAGARHPPQDRVAPRDQPGAAPPGVDGRRRARHRREQRRLGRRKLARRLAEVDAARRLEA
jgi:hypothetical protein